MTSNTPGLDGDAIALLNFRDNSNAWSHDFDEDDQSSRDFESSAPHHVYNKQRHLLSRTASETADRLLDNHGQDSSQPEKVKHSTPLSSGTERFYTMAIALVLVPFPLVFIVFLGYAVSLNRKTVDDDQWTRIQYWSNISVTVFPIVFTLVVGRTTRKFAAWKLERGCQLGTLEQLMGSLSIGATVSTQFSLRSFNILGNLLILLWALSPAGGQALLRLLSTELQPVPSSVNILYFDTDGDTTMFVGTNFLRVLYDLPSLNAMYSSTILAPTKIKTSNTDIWGNVKIPDMSRTSNTHTNISGWIEIPQGPEVNYSSLIGIPIDNIPTNGNTTFAVETSYLSVTCNEVSLGPMLNHSAIHLPNGLSIAPLPNGTFRSANLSGVTWPQIGSSAFTVAIDGFNNLTWGNLLEINTTTSERRTLLLQSIPTERALNSSNQTTVVKASCPITTSYTESSITCINSNCSVTAIRPSTLSHPHSNLTNLAFSATFDAFSRNLMLASGNGAQFERISTPTEMFIQDPHFISSDRIVVQLTDLSLVAKEDLAVRLQQVLNAYWQGSLGPTVIMGGVKVGVDPASGYSYSPKSTDGKHTVWRNVYRCQWVWILLSVLASFVMLVAALAGVVLSYVVRGPDLLGYCSSLTRDTPYVPSGREGSAMDGARRTRELKALKLALCDVAGEHESAGRIAVAEVDGKLKLLPLRRDRMYD